MFKDLNYMARNNNNEQIDYLGNITIAQDQPLRGNALINAVIDRLGRDDCHTKIILGKKVLVYSTKGRKIVLLTKAITYLGNPHPIFKKRIQLPDWYQDFCKGVQEQNLPYDIRFLGVYHYQDTVLFVDFEKDTYLGRGLHNSSAHVYVNDLFQALTYGVFRKQDKNDNYLTCIRADKILSYLNGESTEQDNNLFELFKRFNSGFTFGQWLKAIDAIREMRDNNWRNWRQTEWAGWFLEYRFDKFTNDSNITDKMRYISQKKEGELDFDIRFEEADFYGDLKASDISKNEAPGNDQDNLVECIYRYNKFWYVIYEHESIKDSVVGYTASEERERFLHDVDPAFYEKLMERREKEPDKVHGKDPKMKNQVKFVKMTIIELNKVNFRDALKIFAQGRQADGHARKPKFSINKATLDNDNYAVFRYTYKE